ncbi:ATP-binding protein [Herpetosiphon gulosus]|uniref:Helicase HerA central domain-containing protein n=1 Tax=Herpetosiphon gulosus TaxID=1973496 RepID=A0ABP9WYN7_9CHLR
MAHATRIGLVTSGSLLEGLTARLDERYEIERLRVGQFMVVQGRHNRFFSMLTDVQLAATSLSILADPPDDEHPLLREILAGRNTYGTFKLTPQLMLPEDSLETPRPVKTIPAHFAPIYEASEDDFGLVFGAEGDGKFQMGTPLDMDVPVCIDLARFVERSNGVFGKSGTGKSFLTRLLLCGVIKHNAASNLIFDMHSEYGWSGTTEDKIQEVKGLSQLFPGQVYIYSLDPESSRRRGVKYDGEITIGLNEIRVDDILLLQDALNLNPTAAESAFICAQRFGDDWIQKLRELDTEQLKEFVESTGANMSSMSALSRKLAQLEQLKFVTRKSSQSSIRQIIDALLAGKNVVVEFGQYRSELAYMLVSNILTRLIYDEWVRRTETFLATKKSSDKPPQLMITIEEAHNFLTPSLAKQTIFGKIARELRKYSVTLLVVDQRPSSIDNEVMSQLGSRITALLNDDRDIDAVFMGVGGSKGLKTVLASLDSRQQAMMLGHAVPMPVVMRTRAYDKAFYEAMMQGNRRGPSSRPRTPELIDQEADELF